MNKLSNVQRILLLLAVATFSNCNFDGKKTTAKLYVVEIRQMQFQPALLNVCKGDTVMWVNHDLVAHDVTEKTHKAWSSSAVAPGASWRMVADASADYFCNIHQVMKGKLEVEVK